MYTRQNPNTIFYINMDDYSNIQKSHFSGSRPTKIISHGFLENGFVAWMKDMKNSLLKQGDYNVILVDWGGGSSLPYTQATANTRVVGALLAKLVKFLQAHGSAKPEDVHIIGHSLGAHIAGYAGERTQNMGRITGLDPAGPYFENTDKVVRLDPTDAMFVDAIHTDGESLLTLGFGLKQALAHADYYPNGGHDQPGCSKGIIDNIRLEGDLFNGGKQFIACNHLRAYDYFTESITTTCPFIAYHCTDYASFQQGKCTDCSKNPCGQLGLYADKHKPPSGRDHVKFFLDTSASSPFCRYHYHIQVEFGNPTGATHWRGQLYTSLHGTKGQISDSLLTNDYMYFEPGKTYHFMTHAPHDIGDVSDVVIHWHHSSTFINPFQWNPFGLRHPTLYISKVQVAHGSTKSTLCSTGSAASVETDSTVRIARKC